MTKEFEIVIEELYKTFAKYPFKSNIEGCPCCVSNTDKSTLHSKKLRKLNDDDNYLSPTFLTKKEGEYLKNKSYEKSSYSFTLLFPICLKLQSNQRY